MNPKWIRKTKNCQWCLISGFLQVNGPGSWDCWSWGEPVSHIYSISLQVWNFLIFPVFCVNNLIRKEVQSNFSDTGDVCTFSWFLHYNNCLIIVSNFRTFLLCLKRILVKMILVTQNSSLNASEFVSVVGTKVSHWTIKVSVRLRELEIIICTAVQIKRGKETVIHSHFSGNIIIPFGLKPWEDAVKHMFLECVI